MRAISAVTMLDLPVRLQGIKLATPVDLLLDAADWRALGFEVVCSDGSERFLPFATVDIRSRELAVDSALMLLAELDFYRAHSRSFRSQLASPLELDDELAELRDVLVATDGTVVQLQVGSMGSYRRVDVSDASSRRVAA